jgi:hypothetical protein
MTTLLLIPNTDRAKALLYRWAEPMGELSYPNGQGFFGDIVVYQPTVPEWLMVRVDDPSDAAYQYARIEASMIPVYRYEIARSA